MQKFVEDAPISGVKRTPEGYITADVFAVRTGIQRYAGLEVGRPDLAFVDVYRPEEEVFAKDSLQSFSHIPVTIEHPKVMVSSDNWKELAVGEAGDEVLRDGEKLRIPLIVKDAKGIKEVEDGKRQLSAGYTCTLDWTSGITPDGQSYQAVQRNIRANHLAIVSRGRAGPGFRIGDSWGARPENQQKDNAMNLQFVDVDGISIQTTDQGAQAITKLRSQVDKLNADVAKLTTDNLTLTATIVTKDTEIGTLTVQVADAKKVDVDGLVARRSALVADAKLLDANLDPTGLSDEAIRRSVVTKALGDQGEASDAHISGAFSALLDSTKKDPVRKAFGDSKPQPTQIKVSDSQKVYQDRVSNAWKEAK